uniref:Uncharacterized protein n=1 Tax=Scleropages formosus TaxID=113540 RepID=A0A8C9RN51_SCLFO
MSFSDICPNEHVPQHCDSVLFYRGEINGWFAHCTAAKCCTFGIWRQRCITNLSSVGAPHWVLGTHHVFDALHLLLVTAPVLHSALLGLLQCTLQGLNSLSRRPKTCSVSGTFSPSSSFWMVSFNVLFFSFSFSYFLFHCSAVSSRFTEAVFLMVFALEKWVEKENIGMNGIHKVC